MSTRYYKLEAVIKLNERTRLIKVRDRVVSISRIERQFYKEEVDKSIIIMDRLIKYLSTNLVRCQKCSKSLNLVTQVLIKKTL